MSLKVRSMSDFTIKCPSCRHEFALTEQLAGPMLADNEKRFGE
jgi:C4-type Zn-finger protein